MLSDRNQLRLARAESALEAGFSTEAARKDIMGTVSSIYYDEVYRQVMNGLLDEMKSLREPGGHEALPGKEAELEKNSDLYYNTPSQLSSVREKHFPLFEKYGDIDLLKKLMAIRQAAKDAPLGKTAAVLKAEAKEAKAKSNTVIADATKSLKEEALVHTEKEARDFAADVKKRAAKGNFDPYQIVPEVAYLRQGTWIERNDNEKARKLADGQRGIFLMFCTRDYDRETHTRGEWYWADELVEKYVKECRDQTALHYDSFVFKMNEKAPNPVSAEFTWVHDVWGNSNLKVVLADGTTQLWNTKVIINCSKLGKLFNQWPSRLVKTY